MSSKVAKSSSSAADGKTSQPRKATARADDLDVYMEKLYEEDIESKIEGARMILQLAEYAANIEALVQNESLMVDHMVVLCREGGLEA